MTPAKGLKGSISAKQFKELSERSGFREEKGERYKDGSWKINSFTRRERELKLSRSTVPEKFGLTIMETKLKSTSQRLLKMDGTGTKEEEGGSED